MVEGKKNNIRHAAFNNFPFFPSVVKEGTPASYIYSILRCDSMSIVYMVGWGRQQFGQPVNKVRTECWALRLQRQNGRKKKVASIWRMLQCTLLAGCSSAIFCTIRNSSKNFTTFVAFYRGGSCRSIGRQRSTCPCRSPPQSQITEENRIEFT